MDEKYKEQFHIYARLKAERKLLDARIEELNAILLPVMLEIDGENTKVETELGNFSVKRMKTWTYPQEIVEQEDQVKRNKKLAQQNGTATFEESPSLYFRSKDTTDED